MMSIRAISDRADGTKSVSDGAGTQLLAARNAAIAAKLRESIAQSDRAAGSDGTPPNPSR